MDVPDRRSEKLHTDPEVGLDTGEAEHVSRDVTRASVEESLDEDLGIVKRTLSS
jgi:hypothetical protein